MGDDEIQPKSLPNAEQADNPESLLQWQIEHIKKGIDQAKRGQLIDHEEVKRIVATWRRRKNPS